MDEAKQKYITGYGEQQIKLMQTRALETLGQFLIPYLKPGMQVLECGCGPGTMTIGIAQKIFPGKVIATDISADQLVIAKTQADAAKITNIEFQQADITTLPFSDNTFDLAFSQALLDHLENPLQAILEQKRVVKSGGFVTAHSGYFSRHILYPTNPVLEEALALRWQTLTENGGDIDTGVKLGALFAQADLEVINFSMFCENRDVKIFANCFADEIFVFPYFKKLLKSNRISSEKLQNFQTAWRNFAKTPQAYYGSIWGEAVGKKGL